MINETVKEPLAETVAELITEKFGYGSFIDFAWLEEQLREKRETSRFAFAMIVVVSKLKERGFRLSRQGTQNKGYRILEKIEMQPHIAKLEKQKVSGTRKNFEMLAAVDTSDMKDVDRVKHEHWRDKLGYLYMTATSILRKRKLPEPSAPINPFQIK